MRQLKFRYLLKMDGVTEWHYIDFNADNLRAKFEAWESVKAHSPLLQCTGFKDKNGVEIYVGDIIKGYSKGTIVFRNGSFVAVNGKGKIVYQFPLDYTPEPVVIGNIFETINQ